METPRPAKLIDPVCGMTVDVVRAEEAGLLVELDGRTYAFCRDGCRRAFVDDPYAYVARAEAAEVPGAASVPGHGHEPGGAHAHDAAGAHLLPEIDEGMRRWYESCSCCLSDAYPEIKARLDAERAAAAAPPPGPGICEVAEGSEEVHTAPVS